jgi:hypothetical protein
MRMEHFILKFIPLTEKGRVVLLLWTALLFTTRPCNLVSGQQQHFNSNRFVFSKNNDNNQAQETCVVFFPLEREKLKQMVTITIG